jgi:hypothetical protein
MNVIGGGENFICVGWIEIVRPSRRRLCRLLRMTVVFYAIRNLVILRSAPFETPPAAAPQDKLARLEGRKTRLQRLLCGGEQRQGRLAERFQCPEPAAAVEVQRAQRVGLGQAFERGAAEPAAAPQIGRIRVSSAARFDETLCVGL